MFNNKAWEVSDFAPLWGKPGDIKIHPDDVSG